MDLSDSSQAATGHPHGIRQEAVPRASGDDSSASDAGSSSAVSWKPRPKQQASFSPGLAHVHCVASADPWNDELANIKTGSIDCAVEVQVVVQQTPVKAESSVQEPPKRPRGRLRCCAATLLVLGLLATGVLVPIAVTVGLKQDIPRVYRVLEPPQPSYRLIFAFQSSVLAPAAADVLPEAVASKVTSWAALPSSGVHVARFSEAPAMQQALEHLTAAHDAGSVRRLTSSNSSSSFALKYAVSDFRLVPDRQATQVVDPMQLFDLAKQQARQLLQDQQQHQSSDYDEDEDMYLWRLEQRQSTGQQQRRQKAKKAAEAAAASTGAPRTARQAQGQAQQIRRQLLSVGQEQQQSATAGADAVAAGAMPPVELLPSMTGAAHGTGKQPRGVEGESVAGAVASRTGGSMANSSSSSSSSSLPSVLQRVLLQAASRAVPKRARPQLQVQQRQAQQQVQRGGSMVAWHLADGGLGVRDAWNITSGVDRLAVAVIDSGVELTSSAVGASMWTNAAEVAGDGLDNDGNGYIDDAMGWDFGGSCGDITCSFCVPGPDPTDAAGWGTHAASVIAAQPEVASGTAGIAPGVRIMPLKIADCRHGTQLWDVAAQQGGLQQASQHSDEGPETPAAQAAAQQLEAKAQMQQDSGPVLLGSAAVQALDYALLNGAHIVVAGWSAGPLLDITGGCYLDPTAAAQHGLSSAAARGGSGCVEAVQQQLFLDVLRPLQQAGVLVITTQAGSSSSSSKAGAPAAGPPLPCSLSCELDNLLCVSASSALVPPAGSKGGLVDVVSAADFFAPLINQHSSSYYSWVDSGSNSDAGNSSAEDYGDDSSSTDESDVDSDADDTSDRRGAAVSSGLKLAALSCESAQGRSSWAQLSAPGTDIMAGWSWGSHAVVSGGSAAASVAAGVAALAWSKLGQTLGAEASPGALEGLGQQVKQGLLQGSSISGSSSDGRGGAAALVASRAAASGSSNASFTEDAAVEVPAGAQIERSSSSSSSGLSTAVPGLELDLFGALHGSSQAPGQVLLQPSVMPPGITSACRALRYTWHILNDESGDYDTNAMWYVGRRALRGALLPLTHWEFFGATSLVEVTGYLEVAKPGSYELAASSEDRFVLWLQDWWLHMAEADTVASPGLPPDAWTARVNFTDPGLYKMRLIIYSPSKPFNLQWKLPGSSSFSSLTSFLSFGQAQPLPQQLLHSMPLPMSAQADIGMELGARAPPAPQPKPVAASSSGGQESAPAGTVSGGGQTVVASSSSSSSRAADQLGSEALPESPAADGNSSAAANVSTSGTTNSFTSATSDGSNSTRPGGEQPASSSNVWPDVDAHSSGAATLEPAEGEGGEERMLADDAVGDDSSSSSSTSTSTADGGAGAGMYSSDSGYQLRPGYASYPDSGTGSTYQGGNDFDNFLSSVRRFFGGGWLGRRRSRRRLLLLAATTSNTVESTSSRHASSKSVTAATASSSSKRQGFKQERLQQMQRQLAAATAAAAGAAIRPTAAAARRLEVAAGGRSSGGSSDISSSIWGRFSLALTFVERTQYRTLMPDLTKLIFTHTGVLPGPGLSISGYLQLQKEVLGYADPEDHNGAYGMVQGWLDWQDLNPAAVATAGSALAARSGNSSVAATANANGSGKKNSIATEGAGVGQTVGGVATGRAGVQFEVSCDACSLQVDGMTVVGSLGPVETSACITPAAVSSGASSSSSQPGQQLLQLLMLFTTNDIRRTKISVRSRPCNGLNSPSGSAAWVPLVAAASSPPALGVSSAAVREDSGASTPFSRGMLCSVTAQLPRVAAVAAAANAADSGGSSTLQQVVFLSAEQMREAVTITVNATAAAEESAGDAKGSVADANSSTPVTEAQSSITVDAPAGGSGEGEARQEAAMLKMESGQNSSSNSTDESAAAVEAAMEADRQRRAAQTAAAKAAALARGIRVADLVPDWVDKLPADTEYSFSCGCYWNGSWAGNVSVGVAANSGSGHARLFLAGWPVAAKSRWAFGPSDLDVRSYSTVLQRQQLALDSDSADPLVEAAHLWSLAGSSSGGFSSSSSPHSTRRSLSQGSAADASGGVHTGPAAAALSVDRIRSLRQSRLQQLAVSRTSSSIGSSSSSVLGLQPIGSVDAVSRRQIMPMAGHHQLLVLQGDGLTARGQVVVLAPGDVSSSVSDAAGHDSSAGNTNSNSSSYAVPSSWLPGLWDAWAPAG